ncbi:hypothetical protein [Xanthobacter flavus]|uniref:hypothetical protein n=1 Tax=Xanthobacter flavus TaxID=281 RepID=UPI001AE43858|nr:hypothetical protein [Xanthobacter flavus]MBP2147410.1 hypothetical protein [Xanthobacter flavus]
MSYDDYLSIHGRKLGVTRSAPTKIVLDGVEQPPVTGAGEVVTTGGNQLLDGAFTFIAMQPTVGATYAATADGTGTGQVAGAVSMAQVTSDDVNKIITLPNPLTGTKFLVLLPAATGYELRSHSPATVSINGGSGANAESAIPAGALVVIWCTGAAKWQGFTIAANGTVAGIEAAAA